VIVTRDGSRLFLYTTSAGSAREAERVVRELLAVRLRARWDAGRAPRPLPADRLRRRAPTFVFFEAHKPGIARDLGL
jgi:hypothetical protein